MTAATAAAAETYRSVPRLAPRSDQPERWVAHRDPVPFDDAADTVVSAHLEDGRRHDIVANRLDTFAFGSTDQRTMQLVRVPFAGREVGEPMPLRDLAFSQLCARVGAPASYVRGLPSKLQIANMNWGLARQDGPALLRMAGSEIRAVLSDRYAALDDPMLLEMVADTLDRLGYREDAMVRSVATGPHTVMRITLPGEGTPVKVGDVVEHGIDIANSELGLRSVQVTPITYRLVCLNGMRSWKSEAAMRMRHIGDPDRLREQLRDAIPVAFAEARGEIDRWRRAVDTLMDSALEEVESLRGFGLGNAEVQMVARTLVDEHEALPRETGVESIRSLLRDTPTTAFDVANAITATARDRANTSYRLGLEEVGHRYLVSRTA